MIERGMRVAPRQQLMAEPGQPTTADLSVADAAMQVIDAAERVVVDRIDLMRFDLRQRADRAAREAALLAVGAALIVLAAVALLAAGVVWLAQFVSLQASLASVAALTAVLGGIAVAAARRVQGGS
jgi:hypothetical protein